MSEGGPNLLGRDWLTHFDVTSQCYKPLPLMGTLETYSTVFSDELGCVQGPPVKHVVLAWHLLQLFFNGTWTRCCRGCKKYPPISTIFWSLVPLLMRMNLEAVLKKLKDAGLCLNRSKCLFGQSSLEYLGHIISEQRIQPTADKVKAIKDGPPNHI